MTNLHTHVKAAKIISRIILEPIDFALVLASLPVLFATTIIGTVIGLLIMGGLVTILIGCVIIYGSWKLTMNWFTVILPSYLKCKREGKYFFVEYLKSSIKIK